MSHVEPTLAQDLQSAADGFQLAALVAIRNHVPRENFAALALETYDALEEQWN